MSSFKKKGQQWQNVLFIPFCACSQSSWNDWALQARQETSCQWSSPRTGKSLKEDHWKLSIAPAQRISAQLPCFAATATAASNLGKYKGYWTLLLHWQLISRNREHPSRMHFLRSLGFNNWPTPGFPNLTYGTNTSGKINSEADVCHVKDSIIILFSECIFCEKTNGFENIETEYKNAKIEKRWNKTFQT